ncbi:hypothetical protein SAMN05421788_10750 [Filimonas lacunae]|uniref:DUF445 family protein n=1 Tax=Filimonas lacunae TaxID=477680 RepID=A0A173MG33_9BACT|nr:hypothetical protein [Filimonas lacunae]BAV06391.1 hypothetical protein FLA_2408 [Filimonas lacunae]SIT26772.1 hypothetical protein SAMN05421788_10750 [Filimonas lacunae]
MNICYWLLPFFTAFAGWLSVRVVVYLLFYPVRPVVLPGFKWQGLLPAKQSRIATELGRVIQKELSFTVIEQQLTRPDTFQQVKPGVEAHIDEFLRVKLPKAMPVISMFIGDRTIQQMKDIFMGELETLFPAIVHQYVQALEKDTDIAQLVAEKINSLSPLLLHQHLYAPAAAQMAKLSVIGILVGFVVGMLQLGLMLIA